MPVPIVAVIVGMEVLRMGVNLITNKAAEHKYGGQTRDLLDGQPSAAEIMDRTDAAIVEWAEGPDDDQDNDQDNDQNSVIYVPQ